MPSETESNKSFQHLYEKAREALDRNNFDYAQTLLRNILQSDPNFDKARSLLRITQLKKFEGRKPSKTQKIQEHILLIPIYLKIFFLLWKKKWLTAINDIEKILQIAPSNFLALQKMVFCSLELGWTSTAINTLEIMNKVFPVNSKVTLQLAELYMKEGDLEKAKKYFTETQKLSPGDPTSKRKLKDLDAMSTMEKGGWTDTTTFRDKIRDQTQAELFEKEARIVKSEEDLSALIKDLQSKLSQEPENTTLLKELALLHEQNSDFQNAITTYQRLAKLLPFDENVQHQVSELSLRIIQDEIAKTQAELAKNPSDHSLQSQLKNLEKKKQLLNLEDCKSRVERYPNNLNYRYELGCLYFESEQYNLAIQEFQQSVKDPQRKSRSLYYLGLCFKNSQFYDLAEKQFLKVLDELYDMDDFKKDVIYNLGLVYEATDQVQKAVTEYKKIFEIDISFKDVAEKIKKAYKK